MSEPGHDWLRTVELLVAGDPAAYVRVARLVTNCLSQCRAFDFRDEWEDLVQEVILGAIEAVGRGQITAPGAFVGYVRTSTRNRFIDRLRRFERRDRREVRTESDDAPVAQTAVHRPDEAVGLDVREALARLPEKQRLVVVSVYAEGKTYEEAADATGIPLGSLKRYLRDGLAQLREVLQA